MLNYQLKKNPKELHEILGTDEFYPRNFGKYRLLWKLRENLMTMKFSYMVY